MHKEKVLMELKKNNNPITIEKFLEVSLYGEEGYYTKSNVIGSSGDFITSPEISQLFGEIIGLYILDYWQNNIKKKFNFVELGPGKGTLIFDIINITKKFSNFIEGLNITLIEKNINLINKQKQKISESNLDIKKVNWLQDFKTFTKEPMIILANEFFDCFPIRQFYKKNDDWYEKMIQYDLNSNSMRFKDIKINNQNIIKDIQSYDPQDIIEISKSREKYFSKICKHLANVGGMIIVIDYGYLEKPDNFTLQSICNNKNSNVLDNIGCQDITSLVDFKSLTSIAKLSNLKINAFATQHDFLIKNGIYQRTKKILTSCDINQKNIIKKGVSRIIDLKNMGALFKVLIITK